MLAKWKNILTNWLNCYFNTSAEKKQAVSAESLLNIIGHLRENFSLDESKSSILEAQTLEEFLAEKYPDFSFSDRDLGSEEELYVVASLLLYFVCVTSKDVNIKNAMCNKLGSEDQETIMKFSRRLMESDVITHNEVEAAVLEACSQGSSSSSRGAVAETPPALRSLHGEVRRLQAALDAERFDRNYLQEELARSNLRVEKLVKEKEACKLDILDLRAKLSSCNSQDCQENTEGGGDSSAQKLLKQLDNLEQRLGDTRALLDEALYERDTYKAKVDELKRERDKWVSFGQKESERSASLADQLANERQTAEGLRELVAELRQHQRHNALDTSQLECDDPDASVHSYGHNASVCSEACANVVEIQLGEERAKIVVLKKQIQSLQEQIEETNRKAEEESLSLHKILTDKDGDILELKHRVNEEIEEKDTLKSYYNDQCMRLNNEINELEQKLKESHENSTIALEKKMEEIKTLQEEKLSLLQSLNDETTKLCDVIKSHEITIQNMQSDLYTERNSKQTMKEDYENHMMKLKEKVLNRNNECVELQNNVLEKSEKIELLQCEIRKGNDEIIKITNSYKQEINQLTEKNTALELELAQKGEHIIELYKTIEEKTTAFEQLSKQLNDLRDVCDNMSDQIKCLEDIRLKLTEEVRIRDETLTVSRNELEEVKILRAKEEKSYREILDDRGSTVNLLQAQVAAEIASKNTLQAEITQLYAARAEMADELSRLSGKCEKLSQVVQDKDRVIDGLDLYINEEKDTCNKMRIDCQNLRESAEKLSTKIRENDDEIRALRNVLDNELQSHNDDNRQRDELIEQLREKINEITKLNLALEEGKELLLKELNAKTSDIGLAYQKSAELTATVQDLQSELKLLRLSSQEQQMKFEELQATNEKEKSLLTTRVKETERILKELRSKSNKSLEEKAEEILLLKNKEEAMKIELENEKGCRQNLVKELEGIVQERRRAEDECNKLNVLIQDMTSEVKAKTEELQLLQQEHASLRKSAEDYEKNLIISSNKIDKVVIENNELARQMDRYRRGLIEMTMKCFSLQATFSEQETLFDLIKEIEGKSNQGNKTLNDVTQILNGKIDEMIHIIGEKHHRIEKYEVKITEDRNSFNAKISELIAEHEMALKQVISVETDKYENADHERLVLADQLAEERAFVEDLQAENQALANKHDSLKEQLLNEQSQNRTLLEERDALLKKIDDLNDRIANAEEELSKLLEQNKVFLQEKENVTLKCEEKIIDVQKQIDSLSNDKEMLTQQLLEEKSTKDLVLHEKNLLMEKLAEEKSVKDSIETEKSAVIEEKNALKIQLDSTNENIRILESSIQKIQEEQAAEKEKLTSDLETANKMLANEQIVKQDLLNENTRLLSDKEELTRNILDTERKLNVLIVEKNAILLENESLVKEISEEKSVKDQIEREKVTQLADLELERRKQYEEISHKTNELTKICAELRILKEEYNECTVNSSNIATTIKTSLTRVLNALQTEAIRNELLQKYSSETISNMSAVEQSELLASIAEALRTELIVTRESEQALKHETSLLKEAQNVLSDKEAMVRRLQASLSEIQAELGEQRGCAQQWQAENRELRAEIADLKLQLELKVHSLKEKLVDNENLTEKLKSTYECQIENLNVMSNKLTNYLKDKASELDVLRKEKEKLQSVVEENNRVIQSQDEEIKLLKQGQEKLITDFESERLVLKNMVSVTESIMEDQKTSFENIIAEHLKGKQVLESEKRECQELYESEKLKFETLINEKEVAFDTLFKDLTEERKVNEAIKQNFEVKICDLEASIDAKKAENITLENEIKQLKDLTEKEIITLKEEYANIINKKETELKQIEAVKQQLALEKEALVIQMNDKEGKIQLLESKNAEVDTKVTELKEKIEDFASKYDALEKNKVAVEAENQILVSEREALETEISNKNMEINALGSKINVLETEKIALEAEKNALMSEYNVLVSEKVTLEAEKCESNQILEDLMKLQKENAELFNIVEEKTTVISTLEQQIKSETEQLRHSNNVHQNMESKCSILEEYQRKADKHLADREREVASLEREVRELKSQVTSLETQLNEKNTIISTVNKQLFEEKAAKDKMQREHCALTAAVSAGEHSRSDKGRRSADRPPQVDMSTSDLASSLDSSRTISDLERILQDKNRAITALQADIHYVKTLVADSENKLLDVTKELELSRENNHQLSAQLKKLVQQKNDEIADLKRQLSKMSVTENRASQIIRVSAKYQAIILKRIAEIKSNTVLKELTNFGSNAAEGELRKSIAGSVTMEDLENFLETTDRHLKRCSEKQVLLQKERDRLAEVNRINESEIINMKKFLTEMSVSFKTFNSVKEVYTGKLSRVVAVQRTVRREVLGLEGRVADAALCRLERGYAAAMQDLAECALNMERWAHRSVARTISPEKIKQAFTSEADRASLASGTFQSTSLEVQLEELEKSFQKLLEEASRAQKGDGAKETQASTLMEVRAEYEDKLNRMKAKMKQLYQEQITKFKEQQTEEIAALEHELQKTREKLVESSRGYEEHIRGLTAELWSVGEKFLVKQDEAEWLRRRQRHPSLMSLQNLPNTTYDERRQSEASSLRSLPVHNTHKPDRRKNTALHMSDEEGEVFDNRFLQDLNATPHNHRSPPPKVRLSELRWRNSLCPPHLKSSYPAETQFANAIDEEDIKCAGGAAGRTSTLRKEVGITAYKKPGPPTPSKQAGRLSATDSELRESVRPDADPSAAAVRKTTTPSRIRSLFFPSKNDTNDSTPRTRRRLSIFRNKK